MLAHTNVCLTRGVSRHSPISKWELLRYLGIRLAMCVEASGSCGSVHGYFEDKQDPKSIMRPPEYGRRFHMSRNRFKAISQSLRLSPGRDAVRADEVCISFYCHCVLNY